MYNQSHLFFHISSRSQVLSFLNPEVTRSLRYKQIVAYSEDHRQTAQEQSVLGLHCFPRHFMGHLVFEIFVKKM